MSAAGSSSVLASAPVDTTPIRARIDRLTDDLLSSFPNPASLTAEERRGIIARYTTVLEGNFIYWMTGAYIATKSEEAHEELMENLHEEVKDSHPLMMRKFAIAAQAMPTDADSLAVNANLTDMRLFVGRLQPVPILASMAFFEGLIQKFMPYLAELAALQGSKEMEYTDVHGVCDIAHTAGLYKALESEMQTANGSGPKGEELYEGVDILAKLIGNIVKA
jgi:hypothetical protein